MDDVGQAVPVNLSPGGFIDWVRGHGEVRFQQAIALRQALRFFPVVFLEKNDQFRLQNARALLCAHVDFFSERPPVRKGRIVVGKSGDWTPAAANAGHAVRGAARAIIDTGEPSRHISGSVELSLADSLDALRDLTIDDPKNSRKKPSRPASLERFRKYLLLVLEAEARSVLTNGINHLFPERLWPDSIARPFPIGMAESQFQKLSEQVADWAFWGDWYEAIWAGTFEDWDLAHEVARIEDEVWEGEDALARVAARIREIEAEIRDSFPRTENVPELERPKLLQHVKRLLSSPDMTALAAEGAAKTLSRAITEYLKAAPANRLPDQLVHLENLPALFEGISKVVMGADLAEAKEKRLADQIEALNTEVAKLEAALNHARSNTVNGLFTQSAIRAAGSAFGAGVIGTVGLGLAHFFGQWPDDLNLENLRGFLSDLDAASPKPEGVDVLPPVVDT